MNIEGQALEDVGQLLHAHCFNAHSLSTHQGHQLDPLQLPAMGGAACICNI